MRVLRCSKARNFYPRSPCGERREVGSCFLHHYICLSTLSLRRATQHRAAPTRPGWHFYPRSPCGERRVVSGLSCVPSSHFYPRSPCGERLSIIINHSPTLIFLSTLSLRRATRRSHHQVHLSALFLSTLSLRRATLFLVMLLPQMLHFYPRSPCGERLSAQMPNTGRVKFLSTLSLRRATSLESNPCLFVIISIHALLAESDSLVGDATAADVAFLSTLSLRRATGQ